MDKTKEYVEMCEKAEELKEFWPHRECIEAPYGVNIVEWGENGNCWSNRENSMLIWLPRQDQLQEMIDWSAFSYVVSTKVKRIDDFYNTLKEVPESMEQLWLAFVMKEKYQKVWDGKDWRKE